VLADGVEPFALSALKYGLFALLFLFLWRAMRWVVRGLTVEREAGSGRASRVAQPPGQPLPSTLVIHADGQKPRNERLAGTAVIGRDDSCELRLDDTFVSQQHARIFARDTDWYVEDLGSTNGTFVNEQRLVAPAMLTPGDKIRVGTTVLELRR
jgi:pSer/pThr/pTyr-binding forkhead associated (FHA) protein